jgi:hypothetical protein
MHPWRFETGFAVGFFPHPRNMPRARRWTLFAIFNSSGERAHLRQAEVLAHLLRTLTGERD